MLDYQWRLPILPVVLRRRNLTFLLASVSTLPTKSSWFTTSKAKSRPLLYLSPSSAKLISISSIHGNFPVRTISSSASKFSRLFLYEFLLVFFFLLPFFLKLVYYVITTHKTCRVFFLLPRLRCRTVPC